MNTDISKCRYLRWFLFLLPVLMTLHAGAGRPPAGVGGDPPPAINCPADIVQDNDPGMCSAVVTYTPPSNATLISGLPSGSSFPVGTMTVVYKENGGTDTCFFLVTVEDNEPPVLTCPGDITLPYDAGLCQAVYYDMPVATDNCFADTVVQTAGLPPGSVFPPGQTVNTFEVSDTAGNTTYCSFTVTIGSGHVTVLPGDGSFSRDHAPQGGLRYQRQLFLVRSDEAAASGLASGMAVNSIGFTIGAAQDDTAAGHFRVYLQNTTDAVSRMDTGWTTATTSSAAYQATGLIPGTYEWQVRALCSGSSGFTNPVVFSNDGLSGCNQPYNLDAGPITDNSATLRWECASSPVFAGYEVRYHPGSSGSWQTFTTTDTFYVATGLSEDTLYQWEVRTLCSGDDSRVSASSFQTGTLDQCSEPANLATGTVTDTSAGLSWTAVSGAGYYDLRYRRSGTSYWYSTASTGNNFSLLGLLPGTVYEWKVRTVCSGGYGSFVTGPSFTTSGTLVCYPPDDPSTRSIAAASATFRWLPVPGATSYAVRYRLRESITWANAIAPMTLVCDSLVVVPGLAGAFDIPFPQGTPFVYSGNGLYVAWEFSREGGAITSPNKALCTRKNSMIYGVGGFDSAHVVLCLNGKTDTNSTSLPGILSSTDLRPEIRLGSPSLTDSVAIAAIYGTGHLAIPYGNPTRVTALLKNFRNTPVTYPVTLTVKDAASGTIRHTETINVTVPASCSGNALFQSWSPDAAGSDSVIVSIPGRPGENVTGNNRAGFLQKVNPYLMGYADNTEPVTGAGCGPQGGRILVRQSMSGCGKVIGARVFLHAAAEGYPVYAILLDSTGTAIDSSAVVTPAEPDVNSYYSFFFPQTPPLSNTDFFIGVVQPAGAGSGNTPVGVQWEGPVVREQAYYGIRAGDSVLADDMFPGRLMIMAEIIPGMPVPAISGNLTLCAGDTVTLTASATTTRYASGVNGFSSEYGYLGFNARQALGTPDVYPENAALAGTWLSQTADSQREYLLLGFPDPAPIDFIDIYETFNPGAVDTVFVRNDLGNLVAVWSDSARQQPQSARVNHIVFPRTAFPVSEIRIALNSPAVPGFHPIDAVGIGTFEDPAAFSTYVWTPGGQTTQSISVSTAGTYELEVTSAGNCQAACQAEVVTPGTVIPVITASGPVTFCAGDSVILTSSETQGNTWSTGATTRSITVLTSGSYTVTVDNGCGSTVSAPTTVTVNPEPVVTITGGSICPGLPAIMDAGAGYSSYLWSTDSTSQTISVTAPGLYSVTVTDANGCQGSASKYAVLAPAPMPSISGDPDFCPGESTVLDAGAGYTSYLWSNGAVTQQITVSSTDTFSVLVANSFGCTGSTSVITGNYPVPVPYISGTLSLCAGTTTVLDAGTGYAAYLWSTGETTNFIVVDTAATFTVTVTDFNGCQGAASATTTEDGTMPVTPGPISGPVTGICNASNLVYSIPPVPNTTHYVWTVPPEMTITGGQGTTSITVSAGSLTTGVITVAASNACGQSPSWTPCNLTVYGTPGDPGPVTGQSSAVCGMSGVPYSIPPVPGATSYDWTVPSGATLLTGQGTSSVTVSFGGSFVSGDICVTSVSSCGISDPSCMEVTGPPGMPSAIAGLAEVCKKQKNVPYSVPPVSGATSYAWTVPPQSVITSGQGTAGILVSFGTQSGTITVTAVNPCGISDARTLPVTVVTCNKGDSGILAGDSTGTPGWNNGSASQAGANGSSLKPEVIATAGDFFSGTHATLSWTLGEPVIETVGSGTQLLTQGFQQAAYQVVAINDPQGDPGYRIEVYPVPTPDLVNIVIHATKNPVSLKLELYDMTGKLVFTRDVETATFSEKVELTRYPTGMFILKVTNMLAPDIRSFRIVKCRL